MEPDYEPPTGEVPPLPSWAGLTRVSEWLGCPYQGSCRFGVPIAWKDQDDNVVGQVNPALAEAQIRAHVVEEHEGGRLRLISWPENPLFPRIPERGSAERLAEDHARDYSGSAPADGSPYETARGLFQQQPFTMGAGGPLDSSGWAAGKAEHHAADGPDATATADPIEAAVTGLLEALGIYSADPDEVAQIAKGFELLVDLIQENWT
jgi:hypothetical protein